MCESEWFLCDSLRTRYKRMVRGRAFIRGLYARDAFGEGFFFNVMRCGHIICISRCGHTKDGESSRDTHYTRGRSMRLITITINIQNGIRNPEALTDARSRILYYIQQRKRKP